MTKSTGLVEQFEVEGVDRRPQRRVFLAHHFHAFDLDLLVSGLLTNGFFTRIFRNNNSVFTDTGILLPAVSFADAQWCDYDRDGDLDIAIMGFHQQANVPLTRIYRNDGTSF